MEDLDFADDCLLLNFSPRLRNNIKELWKNTIGMVSKNMKIHINTSKGSRNEYKDTYVDNFVLEIPYAGRKLQWEVLFKDEDYDYPPDFDFCNDLFLFDPDINTILDYIPSLAEWDIENPKSLVCVIKELLTLYKKFQVMRLETENSFSTIYSEYKILISNLTNIDNNIEIYIDNNGTVNFLIGIQLDFSSLPLYIQPMLLGKTSRLLHPCEDTAIFRVSYIKPDGLKVQSDLQLSPRLEQTLGSASILHIPSYNKEKGLTSYVSQVTELLKERIEQVANHYKLKNEYISALLSHCSRNILEYDNTFFSKASLLFSLDNFYVMVCIQMVNLFPQEKPKITLHSVYHLQFEKPFHQTLENYPYSPRWKPEEMIKRLINYLQEEISKFKNTSQQKSQFIE